MTRSVPKPGKLKRDSMMTVPPIRYGTTEAADCATGATIPGRRFFDDHPSFPAGRKVRADST